MKRWGLLFLLMTCMAGPGIQAQMIEDLEFADAQITDILMALGSYAGTTILPDETVEGTASYYFARMDLRRALEVFLSANGLYFTESEGILRVSAIDCRVDPATGLVSLHTEGVDLSLLFRRLMRETGRTILFDSFPRLAFPLHLESASLQEILEMIVLRMEGFEVLEQGENFYVQRAPVVPVQATPVARTETQLVREGDAYTLDIDQGRFRDLLRRLFELADKEYAFLGRNDGLLSDLHFSGKDFDRMLELLLEQGDSDYRLSEGIYYIIDIQRTDVLRNHLEVEVVSLEYLEAGRFQSLMPSALMSGSSLRIDEENNRLILTGSTEILAPLLSFIERVDVPEDERILRSYPLAYRTFGEIQDRLPGELETSELLPDPEGRSFLARLTIEEDAALKEVLNLTDTPVRTVPVDLRYIPAQTLLENPPPSLSSDQLIASGRDSMVFFRGNASEEALFREELALIDQPKAQLRYQLLVIQYQKTENFDWSFSVNNSLATEGGVNSYLGSLGNLLNLNFDLVSLLGYQFSLQLNMSLGNSRASVLANTTLNGLSGQSISFRNTNTYRYTEQDIDPDTQQATGSGVTREIQSGLLLDIRGWVSGEQMITMEVGATVSKQGSTGDSSSAIPTTSERVVETQIRTPSGKPVIIGGLHQQEESVSEQKIPFLGDLPLIGWLFKSQNVTEEDTELVIYLVPYLERPEPPTEEQRMAALAIRLLPGLGL